MKPNTLQECWTEITKCDTFDELENTTDEFPKWFGEWEVQKCGSNKARVIHRGYGSDDSMIVKQFDFNTKRLS